MILHSEISDVELRKFIRKKQVRFGGNKKLKIYGRLRCKSGKRMKAVNRVFFSSEEEAMEYGFRPCGHCMRVEYKMWKLAAKTTIVICFDDAPKMAEIYSSTDGLPGREQ